MSVQTIHRSTHTSNYTVLPNAIWQSGLSVAATSALGYILSRPAHWKIRITDLRNKLGIGRDKVYRTLQELCAAGYAKMTRLQRGVRWEFFDTPQIFETSDTIEPEADSRLPEIKLTKGREALEKNEIPLVSIEEKQLQAAPITLNDPAPKKEIVVVLPEEINPQIINHEIQQTTVASLPVEIPQPAPTVLPECNGAVSDNRANPEIIEAVEKLPVTQAIKPSLIKTLAALTLIEAKAVLAILSRAIVLGKVQNPAGYAIELSKRAKNGTLSPVTTNEPETIGQRIAREEKARQEEAKRGVMSNDEWARGMIAKLGLEAFLKIAPWYVPNKP